MFCTRNRNSHKTSSKLRRCGLKIFQRVMPIFEVNLYLYSDGPPWWFPTSTLCFLGASGFSFALGPQKSLGGLDVQHNFSLKQALPLPMKLYGAFLQPFRSQTLNQCLMCLKFSELTIFSCLMHLNVRIYLKWKYLSIEWLLNSTHSKFVGSNKLFFITEHLFYGSYMLLYNKT